MKLEGKAELTDEKLRDLYILEAPGAGIADLAGLDRCPNLALINLADNEIADLSPLKGLENLQSLDLSDNAVKDLAPLAGLTRLQFLELSGNKAADLGPLSGLEKLAALYLAGNQVENLGPLGSLVGLSSLDLAGNRVKDLAPLAGVDRLATLDLTRQPDRYDVAPLAAQSEIRLLMLQDNAINDLGPLVKALKADAEGPKDRPLPPAVHRGEPRGQGGIGRADRRLEGGRRADDPEE